jgi:hypothetical protein
VKSSMNKPHVFVADCIMPDFASEQQALERAGVTWSMPGWRPPPPAKEVQHTELLQRIAATPRIDAVLFQLALLDAEAIAALPATCKLLQRMGIGLDTAAALNDDRLAGAGLDVYEPEVLPADSPLRSCKNALLTSHTAWYSRPCWTHVRPLSKAFSMRSSRRDLRDHPRAPPVILHTARNATFLASQKRITIGRARYTMRCIWPKGQSTGGVSSR